MNSAEDHPPLNEYSPLVERKRTTSGSGHQIKHAIATLALVTLAALAGVVLFPRAASFVGFSSNVGEESDFIEHRTFNSATSGIRYVPRGSARLGDKHKQTAPETRKPRESSDFEATIAKATQYHPSYLVASSGCVSTTVVRGFVVVFYCYYFCQ